MDVIKTNRYLPYLSVQKLDRYLRCLRHVLGITSNRWLYPESIIFLQEFSRLLLNYCRLIKLNIFLNGKLCLSRLPCLYCFFFLLSKYLFVAVVKIPNSMLLLSILIEFQLHPNCSYHNLKDFGRNGNLIHNNMYMCLIVNVNNTAFHIIKQLL